MTELNQGENNSKEFFNIEMENEESKDELNNKNLFSDYPGNKSSNQGSTKAQSSISNNSKVEQKEEPEEKNEEKKASMIYLKELEIPVQNNTEGINESPEVLDPAYQKEINDYFKEPKDLSSQIQMQIEEEVEENNIKEDNLENPEDNSDFYPLNKSPYDNSNLIPLQPWEKNGISNKLEPSLNDDDEKLVEKEFNAEVNHSSNFIYEEDQALTINYDEIPNFGWQNNEFYDTNYESEDDQG